MHKILVFTGLLILGILVWYLYRKITKSIWHLPLQKLGFHNAPAYPISIKDILETLLNLNARNKEVKQSKSGLSAPYTIQGHEANAYSFAFGKSGVDHKERAINELYKKVKRGKILHLRFKNSTFVKNKLVSEGSPYDVNNESLTKLSLDKPEQFSLSWSTYGNVLRNASEKLLPDWSKTIDNADEATRQFFPIIAKYGSAYNLLILQKVTDKNLKEYKNTFSEEWTEEMNTLANNGQLYIIDLRIYKILELQQAEGFDRFTPATFTWLKQDRNTKELTPFAIHVSGHEGNNQQFYDINKAQKSAWLYALQAVKTSVTVYGIWLGHVYHWHLVTASMVMTMFNNISKTHPIYEILAPQSKYIIGFNDVLVLLWKNAAPPTSITTANQFLELIDFYAKDREFFDDDPTITIENLGLSQSDFTISKPWDMYPIVGYLLSIWEIVKEYVDVFVEHTYANDNEIQKDSELQAWILAAGKKEKGNIKGLPPMDNKEALKRVLTSILYRITAHGISRVDNTANPALTFVGNYPPCLQRSLIPEPTSSFSTEELLQYLPNTGTIGEMITFYYTFVYSAPYEPIIPLRGKHDDLFFTDDNNDPRNVALVTFRTKLIEFMENYTLDNKIPDIPANTAQIHQWPMNVET